MKKPCLRVTKWLGDIPVEAECTACANLRFQVTELRPNREQYQKVLQDRFNQHMKTAHAESGNAGKGNP